METRPCRQAESGAGIHAFAVAVDITTYLNAYNRIVTGILPTVAQTRVGMPDVGRRTVFYLSAFNMGIATEIMVTKRKFESSGWQCAVKYVVNIPSLAAVEGVDCIVLDQQMQQLDSANICDTVLKLRVCGYNNVIIVLLRSDHRCADSISSELARSAAKPDAVLEAPLRQEQLNQIKLLLHEKTVRQAVFMNGE